MEQVKGKDVDAWIREQMGAALLSKRRKSLGGWRKRKTAKKVVHKLAGTTLEEAVGF